MMSRNSDVVDGGASTTNSAHNTLGDSVTPTVVFRGIRINGYYLENITQDVHFNFPESESDEIVRSLTHASDEIDIIILSQPLSFQITMSIILSIIILLEIGLLIAFYWNQTKRVLGKSTLIFAA